MTVRAPTARLGGYPDWGAIRLVVVILGGLLVLQSSDDIDLSKLGYLAVAAGAFGVALFGVWNSRGTLGRRYRYLLGVNGLLFLGLVGSFFVASLERTPVIDWFRDVLGYGLFAAVPVLAFDAAQPAGRKLLTIFLVVAGVLGSLSWAVEWMARRQLADLPLERLVLPAGYLAIALYVFAMAAAIRGRGSVYGWAGIAGAVLGILLATGTRASVFLLVAPLVMAVAARPRPIFHILRVVIVHVVIAIGVYVGFDLAVPSPTFPAMIEASPAPGGGSPPQSVEAPGTAERIGSLLGDPANDPSLRERLATYGAAWRLFASSPVIGVGPGHAIEWIDVSGLSRDEFTADTPLVLPAKLGLVGSVLVFLVAAAYFGVWAELTEKSQSVEALALSGFAAVAIANLPLGMPIEDKAFSFALALLLALAVSRNVLQHRANPNSALFEDPAGA